MFRSCTRQKIWPDIKRIYLIWFLHLRHGKPVKFSRSVQLKSVLGKSNKFRRDSLKENCQGFQKCYCLPFVSKVSYCNHSYFKKQNLNSEILTRKCLAKARTNQKRKHLIENSKKNPLTEFGNTWRLSSNYEENIWILRYVHYRLRYFETNSKVSTWQPTYYVYSFDSSR